MSTDAPTLARIRVETGLSESAIRRCVRGLTGRLSTRHAATSAATCRGLTEVLAALAANAFELGDGESVGVEERRSDPITRRLA